MNFTNATLPWTGASVRKSDNLTAYLGEQLPSGWSRYLPSSISLFVDPQVSEFAVSQFLLEMAAELHDEIEERIVRQQRFVKLDLLSGKDVESFLTQRTGIQPWAIYYSVDGGLGAGERWFDEIDSPRGVVPCSSMQNHGVAWERAADGSVRTWLATSPRKGQDWDWESDIGHESAHAAFAQVPFFVQVNPSIPPDALSTVVDANDLSPLQVAQMIYLYSEIVVVAIRGESRSTATGLPVASPSELEALLRFSAALTNSSAFDRAINICSRRHGKIDVTQGDDIFEIAAPMMRLIPSLTQFTNEAHPPSLQLFKRTIQSMKMPDLVPIRATCEAFQG